MVIIEKTTSNAHSPTLPSLHLNHSSFSNPFHCFTYITAHSTTLLLLHLCHLMSLCIFKVLGASTSVVIVARNVWFFMNMMATDIRGLLEPMFFRHLSYSWGKTRQKSQPGKVIHQSVVRDIGKFLFSSQHHHQCAMPRADPSLQAQESRL